MKSCLKKIVKITTYGTITAILIGGSTVTPIFAMVVGGSLSLMGDWYGGTWHDGAQTPQAYVILGGGLARNRQKDIELNHYSQERTQTLWRAWQVSPLPIITSGVESPWMAESLQTLADNHHDQPPNLSIYQENASMNTCENARFSAKLIQHEQAHAQLPAISHIYLVTDWYHMARARRQFAQVGFGSMPLIAPLPHAMSWKNPKSNLNHSRRAFYEAVALLRDIVAPQKNCRHGDDINIDTIKTPRKQNIKTF